LMARIKRVVYAVGDPKMGCLGGATDLNALPRLNHHLEWHRGILETECRELLQAYFRLKRTTGAALETDPDDERGNGGVS